jgi:hypothetical protein
LSYCPLYDGTAKPADSVKVGKSKGERDEREIEDISRMKILKADLAA